MMNTQPTWWEQECLTRRRGDAKGGVFRELLSSESVRHPECAKFEFNSSPIFPSSFSSSRLRALA